MTFNEAVRGLVPPPWFGSLPGIDRIRAVNHGELPLSPFARLTGVRAAHVGPGLGTWTMPAGSQLEAETGTIDTAPLQETALFEVAVTAIPSGMDLEPVTLAVNYFRPMRSQPGLFRARARVINASRFLIFSEVEIEDPQGRSIAHASSHLQLRSIEPPPPPVPRERRPVEEPSYATPDPYLRQQRGEMPPMTLWQEQDGASVMRMFADGTFTAPYQQILPVSFLSADKGFISIAMEASEWLCRYTRSVAPAGITSFANRAGWYACLTLPRRGQSFVGIDQTSRFFRSVPADGRLLRAEGRAELRDGQFAVAQVHVYDADGHVVSSAECIGIIVDNASRQQRAAPPSKRILATLLFTDLVASTEHAERLGDARWRALLEQHHDLVRAEVRRHEGIEVQTTGDGFLVRFDAPLRALECARAIRQEVKRLGLRLRAGVHVGECELQGGNLSGLAVHVAARIQSLAAADEILVSGTVRELALGSGVPFEERGIHALKGVAGEWRLHALST